MLVLTPEQVEFAGQRWEGVVAVAVDRAAERQVIGWGDAGPHPTFADVPERRTTVTVRQNLLRDSIAAPAPGDEGDLVFALSPAGTDGARLRAVIPVVVLRCTHEVGRSGGAVRTVTFVAVSPDGATDPVTIEPAAGGGL